jgi:hypothetical protein
MKQTLNGVPTPTANLAINKSRLKVYGKKSEVPTYYLNKGQEFQIELFNPTTNNVLAKISLNGKPIAQGGLVLRPGERAFLDRYIDIARKFKFDTYEVADTNKVKQAIKDNGDFKVEFYNEYIPPVVEPTWSPNDWNVYCDGMFGTPNIQVLGSPNHGAGMQYGDNLKTTNVSNTSNYGADNIPTLDFMDQELSRDFAPQEKTNPIRNLKSKRRLPIRNLKSKRRLVKNTKTVETGRVEMGSASKQQMTTVNMNWLTIPFHTVEYKMLPLSQKVNTVQDTQVKRYCTNCGSKNKPAFKFCPSCGTKC